ncbi:MAG: NADPH-dependent FMN reductase [Paracoccaceae bacterium]
MSDRGFKLLGLSGSLRASSTNTALLRGVAENCGEGITLTVSDAIRTLPLFSPDLEGPPAPPAVEAFAAEIARADGLLIACPEYVHALPGAFKNAIDWLVSREEIIGKPIALVHGSHRGGDVLADLERVLSTVSQGFVRDLVLRIPVISATPDEVAGICARAEVRAQIQPFLRDFAARIRSAETKSTLAAISARLMLDE